VNYNSTNNKVRYVARSIHERTTREISLNVVYILMFNSDSTEHVCVRERVLVKAGGVYPNPS